MDPRCNQLQAPWPTSEDDAVAPDYRIPTRIYRRRSNNSTSPDARIFTLSSYS